MNRRWDLIAAGIALVALAYLGLRVWSAFWLAMV